MLAVPLWVLYELGILVASILGKPASGEDIAGTTAPEKNETGPGKD